MLLSLALAGALTASSPAGPPPDTLSAAALLRPSPAALIFRAPAGPSISDVSGLPGEGLVEPEEVPQIIEYSDAYFTRLTIHKWASYLTLPLFVGEYVVGQKLYNGDGTDRLRGLHGARGPL